MPIKHAFTSSATESSDPSVVSKNEWNADHLGLVYTPDEPPSSPSSYDDEFDSYSGWTALGTLDSANVTDRTSHLHLAKASPGTMSMYGIYKAIPSMPFTVTAKLSDAILGSLYARAGLMVLEGSPGKIMEFGLHIPTAGTLYQTVSNVGYGLWTNRTTRSSFLDKTIPYARTPIYLQMVVTSSTSVSTYYSTGGMEFLLAHSAVNPGFTIGNVGLFITGEDNNVACGGWFHWIRFT